MRRLLLAVAILATVAIGGVTYRYQQGSTRERDLVANMERLASQRASRATVESELGHPARRQKSSDCAEQWIYLVGGDRRAALCFDESGHATKLKTGRSFDRQDY